MTRFFFWPLPFFLSTRDSISLSSSTAGVADVQTRKPAFAILLAKGRTRLGILSCKRKAYLPTMGRPLGKHKSSADFGISDLSYKITEQHTANISVVKITLFNCVRVSTVILL